VRLSDGALLDDDRSADLFVELRVTVARPVHHEVRRSEERPAQLRNLRVQVQRAAERESQRDGQLRERRVLDPVDVVRGRLRSLFG
jgi:hypothetical protein